MDNILNDFMWGLSNSDKVVVVLTGVGEKEFSTKEIYEAIDKLQQPTLKPTTEINIDYYNELKKKADFVDKMISPSANEIYKEFEELKAKADSTDAVKRILNNTKYFGLCQSTERILFNLIHEISVALEIDEDTLGIEYIDEGVK